MSCDNYSKDCHAVFHTARNDDKGLPERVCAMPFFVARRLPRLAVGKARNDSSI
ncbi:MAG: hypothetical protein IKI11_08540 [Neisseriaceae bacterium]|nr:hypothetical protein [Neisseriaceae bacterium]